MRAARVLLGIDQRRLAELSGLSVPTIQRMEASETMVRGNVDSLVKLITALDTGSTPGSWQSSTRNGGAGKMPRRAGPRLLGGGLPTGRRPRPVHLVAMSSSA